MLHEIYSTDTNKEDRERIATPLFSPLSILAAAIRRQV